MVLPLNVSGRSEEDLRVISEVGSAKIKEFAERVAALEREIMSLRDLRTLGNGVLPEQTARVLVRQVVALANLTRQKRTTAEATVEALDLGVKQAKWETDALKKWEAVLPALRQLVSSDKISVLAKTLDLAHSYDNLLNSARILIDVRPVFDDARANIVGSIVAQSLRLDYATEAGDRTLTIALDAHDVRTIREECDRALKKVQEAKKLMSERCGLRTTILHENVDDDD